MPATKIGLFSFFIISSLVYGLFLYLGIEEEGTFVRLTLSPAFHFVSWMYFLFGFLPGIGWVIELFKKSDF